MAQSTVDTLTVALKRAAAAHGIYEAEVLGGVYDTEWPQWYAEHMTQTLAAAGHRLSAS